MAQKKTAEAAGAARKAAGGTHSEPVAKRRQLVDAEIYNAATILFASKGYGSTSLQDIADAMGLSRPALYHYVRSKEDILAKLVEEFTESRAQALNALLSDETLNAEAKLRDMVVSTVRVIAEHPLRLRLLDRCENEMPEEMLAKYLPAKRAVRDAFIAVIKEGVASGCFRPVDPRTTAFSMIGMINWVAWWFSSTNQAEIDRVIASVTDLAIGSVSRMKDEPTSPSDTLRSIRRQLEAVELQLAASAA